MLKLIKPNGTIIVEVQYLVNTLKDLTFDNIYHEHYNYWSLTSLVNFFNQFNAKIIKSECVDTHGGSLRIYIKKDKNSLKTSFLDLQQQTTDNYGICYNNLFPKGKVLFFGLFQITNYLLKAGNLRK